MNRKQQALENYLVTAARMGERAALEKLVILRSPRLMAHAVRLLGEVEAARDVVQAAWVEIIRALPKLRDPGAFLPWALRIVSRRAARVISQRQKQRRLSHDYAQETEIKIEEGGPDAVDRARVRTAIASLPPEQAATIALFYLEEMSVAAVAIATDVPVGTVKTRLMSARAKLRAILEGENHGKT